MRKFSTALIIFALISQLDWNATALRAQSREKNFDVARMERDINIMETILDKLILEENKSNRFVFSSNQTRGLYLPNFGVIFQVSPPSDVRTIIIETQEKAQKLRKRRSLRARKSLAPIADVSKIDREKILEPIIEFLGNYADAIGQLAPQNKVMIIYSLDNDKIANLENVFVIPGADSPTEQTGLAIWATRKDISDFRSRKINETEFKQRLKITELAGKEQNTPDLRIMARVLETGLKSDEDNIFKIYGDASHLYLNDFGALFFFEAQYSNRKDFDVFLQLKQYKRSVEAYEKTLERVQKSIKEANKSESEGKTFVSPPVSPVQVWTRFSYRDSTRKKKILKALQKFENRVQEYLVDYGRTVRIVKPDQWIVISVKTRGQLAEIPERVVFQVRKSDLDAYDQRKISRKTAMARIQITRYER